MQLIKKGIMVEWVRLGEGLSGDYNPNDPEDVELLRFDVSKQEGDEWSSINEWIEVPDASYCTLFPVNTKKRIKMKGLQYIMNEIWKPITDGHSIKKICEQLSWISPEWVQKTKTTEGESTMEKLVKIIDSKNKGKLLAIKPFSSHPDDRYLHIVLIERDIERDHDYDPYVVWTFNSYYNGGFFGGDYFMTLEPALNSFNKRGGGY